MLIELLDRVGGKQRLGRGPQGVDQISYLDLLPVESPAEFFGPGSRPLRFFSFLLGPRLGSLPAAVRGRLSRLPDCRVVVEGQAVGGSFRPVQIAGDIGPLPE